MDVKEAVETAKKHVSALFKDENATNIGLEEIQFDESNDAWDVTIGFSRPWDLPRSALGMLTAPSLELKRVYKVVRISNSDGKMISVKNRLNG